MGGVRFGIVCDTHTEGIAQFTQSATDKQQTQQRG